MAVFTACLAVRRIPLPHFKIVVFLVIFSCGTEIVRDFLSLRIEEIAVRVRPTDDVFGVLEWYLFAALVKKPDACGLVVTHSIREFGRQRGWLRLDK